MPIWEGMSWIFFLCLASYLVKGYLSRRFAQVSVFTVYHQWDIFFHWVGEEQFEILCVNCVYLAKLYLFFFFPHCFPLVSLWCTQGACIKLMMSGMIVFPVAGHFAGSSGYVLENHTNWIWRHWCAFSSKSLALGGFI